MDIKEIIISIKSVLTEYAPDAKALLYGSYARGEEGPESDVDLLILLPEDCKGTDFIERKIKLSGLLYDLSLKIGKDISPLILIPSVFYSRKTPFTQNVLNDSLAI